MLKHDRITTFNQSRRRVCLGRRVLPSPTSSLLRGLGGSHKTPLWAGEAVTARLGKEGGSHRCHCFRRWVPLSALVAISAACSARLRVPPPQLFIRTGLPGATYAPSLAGTWTLSGPFDFSPLLLLLPGWFFFCFKVMQSLLVSVSKTKISLKKPKSLPDLQIFCLLHFIVAVVSFLLIWATTFT